MEFLWDPISLFALSMLGASVLFMLISEFRSFLGARAVRRSTEEDRRAARLTKPVAALAEAVRVEDTETTTRACADILGGGKMVLPMLIELWKTADDARVREAAAIIIKSFAERFDGSISISVPFLMYILTERKDEKDVALAMAIVSVMKRHARPLVPLLRETAAKDTRKNLRTLAVETLDKLGQKAPSIML